MTSTLLLCVRRGTYGAGLGLVARLGVVGTTVFCAGVVFGDIAAFL